MWLQMFRRRWLLQPYRDGVESPRSNEIILLSSRRNEQILYYEGRLGDPGFDGVSIEPGSSCDPSFLMK